ncbi:PAS domain S-box protein [Allohahella marinimesophila]|uniref:histidine kinase n=1 Tax=Allohahella marinimesophila TaxID=1054972 RepID=A0ABP7NJH2_9GAMM
MAGSEMTDALLQTAYWLRTTLDSIGDAVIAVDSEGRVTFVNAVAETLSGWTFEDAGGLHLDQILALVNADTRNKVDNPIFDALRKGEVVGLASNTLLIARDGTERPIDDSAAPIRDRDNRVSGAVIVFRDISERRAQKQKIEDALAYATNIIGTLRESLLVLDDSLHVVSANAAFYENFQLKRAEIEGRLIYELGNGEWNNPELKMLLEEQLLFEYKDYEVQQYLPGRGVKVLQLNARRMPSPEHTELILLAIEDITERRQAEEKLQMARSRLNSTLGAAEIGTWEYDLLSNRVWADANLANMFQVTQGEAAGGPVEAYTRAIHPDDRDRVKMSLAEAVSADRLFEAEYRLVGAAGEIRWVVARGRLEKNASGTAIRLPGVAVDITSRKVAEQKLQASEDQRKLALDAAELGAWHLDPESMQLSTDARSRAIFGIDLELVDFERGLERMHPDDRERVRAAVNAALNPVDPQLYEIEYRVQHPDGSWRWIYAKGRSLFDHTGNGRKALSFDGTAADITARKQAERQLNESEKRFRRLFESAKDGILILDAENMSIIDANPYMSELLGYSQQQFHGKQLWEIGFFKDKRQSKEAMEALRIDGYVRYDDLPLETRLGRVQEVEFICNVYEEENRRMAQCNVRDITERKAMERQITQQSAELADADRHKDEFLAMLAHELRNPLAPVFNALELIRHLGDESQTQHDARGVIERQVRHLARLVDDLTEVSRISSGRIRLNRERVTVNELVERAVERVRPLIERKRQTLMLHFSSAELFLFADATRLEQAFGNLLNNASKYSSADTEIRLSVTQIESETEIRVKDEGVGIEEELLPRIFDLFTQGDKSLDRSEGGLGIGLALVKNLIDLHGGSITAKSEGSDLGSEFVVRLPLDRRREREAAPEIEKQPAETLESMRILVVDDNTDAAHVTAMLLDMWGHEVRTAHDGTAALEMADSFMPQVVLLDIGLPLMDGYEVATRLRSQPAFSRILLVAMTGYGQEEDRRLSRNAGFDEHLVKPVEAQVLRDLIEAYQAQS